MSSKHAARISGDDYQHLYSWWLALAIKFPDMRIARVIIEDKQARSVDDVTVRHEPGTELPDRFYQIKYHVDHRRGYTAEQFIIPEQGQESLLEKFWFSWQHLRQQVPDRPLELYLVSNWTWGQDGLSKWISGATDSIDIEEFFAPSAPKKVQDIRKSWQDKLKANDQDFQDFISCLHFRLGYSASVLMHEQVVERMRHLRLKTDLTTLIATAGIVRDWLKTGQNEVTLDSLNATLKSHNLYLPAEEERCVTVYMETIEKQKYERPADYCLSWCDYFLLDSSGYKRTHQLKDPANWNATLLPQLYQRKEQINQATDCRFVRVRGQSRLSCWFAFGFVFAGTASYTLEVKQAEGLFWRTDAPATQDFSFTITSDQGSPYGELLDGDGDTVALGISVSGPPLDQQVRQHLAQRQEKVAALLLLSKSDLQQRLQSASEVVALADKVKCHMRQFIDHWKAKKLLLFYQGPLSGACFIGHKLNALHADIQIMEDQQPGYVPSFLLPK